MYTIIDILIIVKNLDMAFITEIFAGVSTLLATGITIYIKKINSSIKTIEIDTQETKGKLSTLTNNVRDNNEFNKQEHIKLFSQLKKQNESVRNILSLNSLEEELNEIMAKHVEYLVDSPEVIRYLENKIQALKEFSAGIINGSFNFSSSEIKAKVENYFEIVHGQDKLLGDKIIKSLQSNRGKIEKDFKLKITQIICDELVNSTNKRFSTAIIYFLQLQSVLLVKTILKTK